MTTTKHIQKKKHVKNIKELMIPSVFNTDGMVSMDQCKELIDIEKEFGSCIVDRLPESFQNLDSEV